MTAEPIYAGTAWSRVVDALTAADCPVRITGDHGTSRCPAHDDRTPSLSLRDLDGRTLITCHGGCSTTDVLAALGLRLADLFDQRRDRPTRSSSPRRTSPTPHGTPTIDGAHLAARMRQQARIEADPAYWRARADEFDAANRPEIALACRRHATLLDEKDRPW